jgi:hypothetical protein
LHPLWSLVIEKTELSVEGLNAMLVMVRGIPFAPDPPVFVITNSVGMLAAPTWGALIDRLDGFPLMLGTALGVGK